MKKLSEALSHSASNKRFAVGAGTLVAWFVGGYCTAMLPSEVSAKTVIQTPVAIEGPMPKEEITPKLPEQGDRIVPYTKEKIVPKLPKQGDRIVPYTGVLVLPEEQPLANVKAGSPVVDPVQAKRNAEFEREYQNLLYTYQAKTNDQVILPVDIADIQLHTFKDNFWSKLSFFGKKKALSVYLDQHKKAKRFYGLYEQRMIAWHKGVAPDNMTVEKAINEEALFPFLKIQLVSNQTTDEMLKYLDGRLSAKDSDIVKRWVFSNSDKSISANVAEVITQGILEQKNASLMKW